MPACRRVWAPARLLEKDVGVVWSLRHLFAAPYAPHLVFKGGTSSSMAHGVIQRFPEDVDLTCDIRAIAADLIGDAVCHSRSARARKKNGARK
ncbi:putative nucleotidyltransferase component of viral defense system [Variovorax boronicumulans]|uniref:Nucleotidyltransferase component of viral defense system n=1 Tax=Variovorax boronicumulans TaxID=436515 RepID=A0AAW8D955_9BURK|nr:nucleotidyl transferase AbiEii/AbiGii toxin family protein [Variovorax boronicumulans]MDP9896396.1 putative nucleotidyltransferase component of viral defense system [Variovorax boronicumulans]MDQ0056293.1 putative nucleotidyltransferase component of viral defense system [Variovorax boronicumulans]